MRLMKMALQYMLAALTFLISYGVANLVIRVVLHFQNRDLNETASYWFNIPISAIAGIGGAYVGVNFVSGFLPSVRISVIVWAFAVVAGLLWLAVFIDLRGGSRYDPEIPAMFVQMVAAVIAAFAFSRRIIRPKYAV